MARGGTNITVTRVGDWSRMLRVGRKLQTMGFKVDALLYAEAQDLKMRVKRNIKAQTYDWPPLSSKYARYKAEKGLDRRTLIATGDYLNAIRIMPAGIHAWQVGVPKNATNRDGDSLAEIGLAHEYGTGRLPPRPFWRQEYAKSRQRLAEALIAATRGLFR